MTQLVYQILSGSPNFTASIIPAVSSNQILTGVGIYSFDNIPEGVYILTITDNNGCKQTITVDLSITTTTSTSTTSVPTTTTTSTTACQRPVGLIQFAFITGYTTISPASIYVSTGTLEEACHAINFIISENPLNVIPTNLYVYTTDISIGAIVYLDNSTNDCTCIPDGWYFTDVSYYTNQAFYVSSCIISMISSCIPSTTTTSTTVPLTTTTTSTTTSAPLYADCDREVTYRGNIAYPVEYITSLGASTGICYFIYNAFTVPDRFIVTWNSIVQIDTGYTGDVNYDFGGANRAAFNFSLLGLIDPITTNPYPDFGTYADDGYPRVTAAIGIDSFNKTNASPADAIVDVYVPMGGTVCSFTLGCPGVTTSTTTTTIPTTSTTTTSSSTTTTSTTISPAVYGQLYNWYAAHNSLLPPAGWHVPIDNDWGLLFASLGNTSKPMKTTGNTTCSPYGCGLWAISSNPALYEGTNTSGFSINPSGVVRSTGVKDGRNSYANFWMYDENSGTLGKYKNFGYGGITMYENPSYYDKHYGFDIRLIKDDTVGYTPGSVGTLTDIDGNVYPTKMMPDGKVWMTENLRVSRYTDGSVIPVDPADWSTTILGAMHTYI